MHQPMPEIHSCISLIEQAAGLQFNLPAEIGDLAFQLCGNGRCLFSKQPVGLEHVDYVVEFLVTPML